ncbi:putative chitinase 1 [Pecten maximus]|uniref:putative chitinase 1 n=1 Tax=Pecten maximus TaxID=6579 RepID=UPI00145826EF|nr:putative chitinase 1 [Pecten maximus]
MDAQAVLLGVLVLIINIVLTAAEFNRVCFYSGWSLYRDGKMGLAPEDIDPYLCTHVVFAYATLDDTGTQIRVPDGYETEELNLFRRFHSMRSKNEDLVMMLSVGGWATDSKLFSKTVSSEENMQHFAEEAINYLRKHDFDGLDIDWQFPATRGSPPEDVQRYYRFLRLLQWEFEHEEEPDDKSTLILTISVDPTVERATISYDLPRYSRWVNWINMKMFDFYGHWNDPNVANHHSALYSAHDPNNVNNLSRYWVNKGVPRHKIVLGLPMYGRSFTLVNRNYTQAGAPTVGPGADEGDGYPISQLCHLIKNGAKEMMIADKRVPYVVINNEWIGYDNPESIKQKARIVFNNFLGGVMIWTLDMDDYRGSCGVPYPLMNAALDGLHARHGYKELITNAKQDQAQQAAAKKEIYRQRALGWQMQDQQESIHTQQRGGGGGRRRGW